MPERRKCRSETGKPAGSIIAALTPKQAQVRSIAPGILGDVGLVKREPKRGGRQIPWLSPLERLGEKGKLNGPRRRQRTSARCANRDDKPRPSPAIGLWTTKAKGAK